MLTLRPSAARGHAAHDWLETFHTISFADYHDTEVDPVIRPELMEIKLWRRGVRW